MSGPMRFRFAAGLIVAGLSTSPASSNPLTALFNSAPEPAAAPAPAEDECLPRPGKPADGQHWMYHLDGHRKCWFPAAAETATAKKAARRSPARRRLAGDEDTAARPRSEAIEDARAEVLPPTLTAKPQPAPPGPVVKPVDVADAGPGSATGAAAMVPPPPVLSKGDRRNDDNASTARQDGTETLVAATPADSETAAISVPATTPVVDPIVATSEEWRWWMSPWIGPLLMALGALVLLLSPIWNRPRAAFVAASPWCPDVDDRDDLLDSDFTPRTRSRERHAQATSRPMPHHSRQTIEDRTRSRPAVPTRQDMTFQDAIKVLADVDAGRNRVERRMQES